MDPLFLGLTALGLALLGTSAALFLSPSPSKLDAAPKADSPQIPATPSAAPPQASEADVPDQTADEPTEEPEPTTDEAPTLEVGGLTALFRNALGRTRDALNGGLGALFGGKVDESLFDDLEMALLSADVGMPTTEKLLAPLRRMAKDGTDDPALLRDALRTEMRAVLARSDATMVRAPADGPHVLLVVGVNGSGKTTTIGKLSNRYSSSGKKVLLAAADTYRAAAGEQLTVWAERSSADIVAHKEGADPGAVVYDALAAAKAREIDVVIIDTAGRLQTKKPLMEQLSKICRVIDKQVPGAPHETLLVVDGTIGQNAMSQAKLFNEAAPLSGVCITKLDGTAKGGMVLAIAAELGLPVKLVGVGEKIEDLRDFDADAFVSALA